MNTTTAAAEAPRHPFIELLARYRAIFKAAWDRRDELAGPKRMLDERAFLPAAIALQETPPHPAPHRAIIAICALFTIALLWACFGQIDIVAVAQGRVVVSQRSKTLQPLETSVVKAIHVKDGDKVKAADLLIELDSTLTAADSTRVTEERSAAQSESLRSQALLTALRQGSPPSLPAAALKGLTDADRASASIRLQSEWADISAKLAKFAAETARRKAEIATGEQLVAKLQTTLPLAQQREKDFKSLTEQGFVANHAGQDRTRERVELERDLATAQARLQEAKAALAETEQGLQAYRAETLRTLQDREAQAGLKARQLAEEGTKADKRNQLTRLTAPVAGTVQQLAVHTTGGVVKEAEVLLVLVPDDAEVTAEVVLENKDVGFVRNGQEAAIKLETFPYTRYGTVQAQVQSITADAVQDEKRGAIFPATLVLNQSAINVDGKRIKLAPGMNLTAEIKTGKRRVIDYLLSPVQQHLDESLKER
ncbi:HlyD family type I secretion periplasmic adaptor subunit [Roseateles cellulosilyticus]|uniref:Membrane fusion protein (MFP) family protein n=1 Tax=Pelomonas cellulosilytica TaxID=2906762 RepID=A0ABS8Y0R9_9BURK|nr:HlyD family type I secretion periplasmic adaptor subunit [Pelomonas sp. P8]MCE4556543.1 HlyD family type I secretion periplasmic adaptor subunit [Pelomonas sp. P8]